MPRRGHIPETGRGSRERRTCRGLVGACVLAALVCLGCHRRAGNAPPVVTRVVLHVSTDGEFLAFVPTELSCPTGAQVRVVFRHAGKRIPQKHNWVLVFPGTEPQVEKAGTAAGEASNWLPPHDRRVLASTPLCSPGGEAVIEFTAPAPGDYPYLCTTPGHAFEMHGVLHVTRP